MGSDCRPSPERWDERKASSFAIADRRYSPIARAYVWTMLGLECPIMAGPLYV